MSPTVVVVTAAVGGTAGLVGGAAAAVLLLRFPDSRLVARLLGVTPPKASPGGLTLEDRDHLAGEFQIHARAVAGQVSAYADLLADGDLELRERLRQFERGGLR